MVMENMTNHSDVSSTVLTLTIDQNQFNLLELDLAYLCTSSLRVHLYGHVFHHHLCHDFKWLNNR